MPEKDSGAPSTQDVEMKDADKTEQPQPEEAKKDADVLTMEGILAPM